MPTITSAIIFVNKDLVPQIQGVLTRQLFLDEIMDGYEFDARVASDSNYPVNVHMNNLKILVLRDLFDLTNRNLADVVMFIKAGQASIEQNKFGPPGQTYIVDKLTLNQLFRIYPPVYGPVNSSQLCEDSNQPALFPFGSDPPVHFIFESNLLLDGAEDIED